MVSQYKTLKQCVFFFLLYDISDDFMTVLLNGSQQKKFTLGIFIFTVARTLVTLAMIKKLFNEKANKLSKASGFLFREIESENCPEMGENMLIMSSKGKRTNF